MTRHVIHSIFEDTLAKNFSWFYDCPGPPPGSMVTDNAPEHPWTTPGALLYTKSWRRSAKVVQSGSRWSTVVQSGPGSTRRQKQLFNFFADVSKFPNTSTTNLLPKSNPFKSSIS